MIDYSRLGLGLALGLIIGALKAVSHRRSLSSETALAESLPYSGDRVVVFGVNRIKMFLNAIIGLVLFRVFGSPFALILLGPQSLEDWILILGLGALFPYAVFLELRAIAGLFVPDILTVDDKGFSIRRLGRTRDYRWSEVDEPRFIQLGNRVITTAIEVPFCLSDKRPLKIMAEEYWGSPESMLSVMLHKYRRANGLGPVGATG